MKDVTQGNAGLFLRAHCGLRLRPPCISAVHSQSYLGDRLLPKYVLFMQPVIAQHSLVSAVILHSRLEDSYVMIAH